MSNESVERFEIECTGAMAVVPVPNGDYVRYSDHERVVKELAFRLAQSEQAFELETAVRLPEVGGLNVLQITRKMAELHERPSLSDAIKEVERTRDAYRAAGESSGLPNDMTASRDIHTANALDVLITRLKTLEK